ncbi:hypothetical protein ACSGOQ_006101 [Escherichia coli]|uniref:hypothetical protein n=1 Tax=Escherichia coli TaxID=562 RepID=UPI0021CE9672|nr:hypothetical protein [Escherichia coli]MCU6294567.1 hypothetical protein [Escherichia coli]USL83367.1 hypothetical protein A4_291 [Escherichia phage A4]
MAIIAKTEIIGLDSIIMTFEEQKGMYVVSYGDYVREYETVDEAFESYIRQVNKAYDDYR